MPRAHCANLTRPGALAITACAIATAGVATAQPHRLDVELVADGLVAPVDLTFAADGSGRRFIVDQTGLVLILTPEGDVLPEPFLDIVDQVVLSSAFDERGLLSLAFHPDYATNGKLYIHYSAEREGPNICVDEEGLIPADPEGCPFQHTRRISEFTVSPTDPNRVDPASERVIFSVQWPGRKHNGGGLAFGLDGLLYIGLGDGGWIHGPDGGGSAFDVNPDLYFGDLVAQDLTQLYGKILRIDVDRGDPYAIPPHNPFAGHPEFRGEIFAWGFRNPFRVSFDRQRFGSLDMFVSVHNPGNYGWGVREGSHSIVRSSAWAPPELFSCTIAGDCPQGPQMTFCGPAGHCIGAQTGPLDEPIFNPVIEYLNFAVEDPRSQFPGEGFGRASLGGHLYRGKAMPGLVGKFVQGDFAINDFDGQIIVATPQPDRVWDLERAFVFDASDPERAGFLKSIGQDAEGELYAITGNSTPSGLEGRVWKIINGCRPDLDGDGVLGFFDFLALQNLFAAGDRRADFTGDGELDFFDFLAFQNEFAAGCP
jgi:glucose/arabinose dehydrogenase